MKKKIISLILAVITITTIFPAFLITNGNAATVLERTFKSSEFSYDEDTDYRIYWLSAVDEDLGISLKLTTEGDIEQYTLGQYFSIISPEDPIVFDIVSSKFDIAYLIFNSSYYPESIKIDCERGKTQSYSIFGRGSTLVIDDKDIPACDEIIVGYVDDTKNTLNVKDTNDNVSIFRIEDINNIESTRGERTTHVKATDTVGQEITIDSVTFEIPSNNPYSACDDWTFFTEREGCYMTISVPDGSFITKVKIKTRYPENVLKCEYGMLSSNNNYDVNDYGWQEISFGKENKVFSLTVTSDKWQLGTEMYVEYYDVKPWMTINFNNGTSKSFSYNSIKEIKTNTENDFYITRVEATDNGTTYKSPIKNFCMTIGTDDRNNNFYAFNANNTIYNLGVKDTTIVFAHDCSAVTFDHFDAATCTTNKINYYKCYCGELVPVEIKNTALGHLDIIAQFNTVYPTCTTEGGYDNYNVCARCCRYEFIEHITLKKTAHTPGAEIKDIDSFVEPTCTKAGTIDIITKCVDCKEELTRKTISLEGTDYDALGHIAGEWVVERAATEDETGIRVKRCKDCNEILEEEVIEKLPKKEEPVTDNDDNDDKDDTKTDTGVCDVCGKNHVNNGFQNIICAIRRFFNMILKLFK